MSKQETNIGTLPEDKTLLLNGFVKSKNKLPFIGKVGVIFPSWNNDETVRVPKKTFPKRRVKTGSMVVGLLDINEEFPDRIKADKLYFGR